MTQKPRPIRQVTHPTEMVQEGGDKVLGLPHLDAEPPWPLGQPPGRKAIDDAVSDPLGLLTLLSQHCPVCSSHSTPVPSLPTANLHRCNCSVTWLLSAYFAQQPRAVGTAFARKVLQNSMEQWGMHFARTVLQCSGLASMQTCVNSNLHRCHCSVTWVLSACFARQHLAVGNASCQKSAAEQHGAVGNAFCQNSAAVQLGCITADLCEQQLS